ncbi:MAG: hypothetical protein R2710_05300 [Acidimicrobiales bacterium]
MGDETVATDAMPRSCPESMVSRWRKRHRSPGGASPPRPFEVGPGVLLRPGSREVQCAIDEGADDRTTARVTALDDPVVRCAGRRLELVVVPGADIRSIPTARHRRPAGDACAGEPCIRSSPIRCTRARAAELDAVTAEANTATANDVHDPSPRSTTDVSSSQLRSWSRTRPVRRHAHRKNRPADGARRVAHDAPRLGSEDQLAHFDIVDSKPIIVPPSESVVCCADDTPEP